MEEAAVWEAEPTWSWVQKAGRWPQGGRAADSSGLSLRGTVAGARLESMAMRKLWAEAIRRVSIQFRRKKSFMLGAQGDS